MLCCSSLELCLGLVFNVGHKLYKILPRALLFWSAVWEESLLLSQLIVQPEGDRKQGQASRELYPRATRLPLTQNPLSAPSLPPHSLCYFFASHLSDSFFLPATPSFLPQMLMDCFVTSPYVDMAVLCAGTADKGSTKPLVSSQHSVTATCFGWLDSLLPSDPNYIVSPRRDFPSWSCSTHRPVRCWWTIVLSQHCGIVYDVAVDGMDLKLGSNKFQLKT